MHEVAALAALLLPAPIYHRCRATIPPTELRAKALLRTDPLRTSADEHVAACARAGRSAIIAPRAPGNLSKGMMRTLKSS